MNATMNCPGCQTQLRLREDMAGKKIKCPRCARIIAIPAGNEETLEEVTEPEARITQEPIAKAQTKPTPTRRCPECGQRIPADARKCRHCKAELDDEEDEEEQEGRPRTRSRYKPCPRCGARGATRVMFTFWGSFYGPALFTHVRCPECGYAYNGRSGRSNLLPAIFFVTIPLLLICGLIALIIWFFYKQGWF